MFFQCTCVCVFVGCGDERLTITHTHTHTLFNTLYEGALDCGTLRTLLMCVLFLRRAPNSMLSNPCWRTENATLRKHEPDVYVAVHSRLTQLGALIRKDRERTRWRERSQSSSVRTLCNDGDVRYHIMLFGHNYWGVLQFKREGRSWGHNSTPRHSK